MSTTNGTVGAASLTKIEQWEEAWADYIFALDAWDATLEIGGDDFVYWCGIAGRRLDEAKRQLRHLDPEFCKSLDI